MIDSLLGETCSVLHWQEGSRDSFNQFDFWEEENVSCIAISLMESVRKNPESNNLVRDFDLYLSTDRETAITAKDRIVYNSYEYDIVPKGIWFGKDLITMNEEFVVLSVQKRKEHPPEMVEIKRR